MTGNFWDTSWYLYILGFLLAPRITIIIIFTLFVTMRFEWTTLFVPLTIWWLYPSLGLGFWSKLVFSFCFVAFPRLLLGLIGYLYLFPANGGIMVAACIIGFLIDSGVKNAARQRRSQRQRGIARELYAQ